MATNRINGYHGGGKAAGTPDPDRLPPHNLEAERGVLGSMMFDPSAIDGVAALLDPGDFYRSAHQVLYRTIRDLYFRGRRPDSITLIEELEHLGRLDEVGGEEIVSAVVGGVPHAANVMQYAAIVRDRATVRKLIEGGNAILRAAYDPTRTPDSVLVDAERTIFEIGERALNADVAPVGDCLDEVMDALVSRVDGPGEGTVTGLDDLDDVLHGFRGGEVTVLAARPGMGKTSIALELASRVALDGIGDGGASSVLFLSLEMGRRELTERLLAQQAGVDGDDLKAGGAKTRAALDRIESSGARVFVRDLPLQIDDVPTRTVMQAAAIMRRAATRSRLRLVVIDYLQLLAVEKESRRELNREQQIAEITRSLKVAAREMGVPILLLAQLNREVEKRADNRPVLSDLRESGAIEQDADVVLMLYRDSYYDPGHSPNVAEVLVRKNRHGRTGKVEVYFDPRCGRWGNLDRHHGGPGGGFFPG